MKNIGLSALVILKWFCCLTRTVMTSTYITARTTVYNNNNTCKRVLVSHDSNNTCTCTYVLYTWKFSPGENFRQFHHLLSLAKFLSHEFFSSYVNHYIEDMATLPHWWKFIPPNISALQKVSVLGEFFIKRKFSRIRYYHVYIIHVLMVYRKSGDFNCFIVDSSYEN